MVVDTTAVAMAVKGTAVALGTNPIDDRHLP